MKDFQKLYKNLKKDFSNLKQIKVALLGDSSIQFLNQSIRASGYDYGLNLLINEGEYNQVEQQIFNSNSFFFEFDPEIVILFFSSHKLLGKYNKLKVEFHQQIADSELERIENLVNELNSKLKAKIIFYNYAEIDDSVFGNFANKLENSFLFQLRKLNFRLMEFAINQPNFYICDISTIQNQIGKSNIFKSSIYVNSDMVLNVDSLPIIAARTVEIINALNGKFKKCLIVDLDNTMWGGVIGDDGIENIQIGNLGIGKAFSEFQYWIKKLQSRGIIIAICSKNSENIAKEPFEHHPEMVIHLEDIAVFIANWENKPDNIRQIQSILNIGFDSMVFLDDNSFERNIVRESIPEIEVPELPDDPAEYLEFLYKLNLFETISYSKEDSERTKLYKVEAERNMGQLKFMNEADFLKSLNMISDVQIITKFNTPRIAQLTQRSNQFNLRTIRYDEAEITRLSLSNNFHTFAFTLDDKFGELGLISVVILKRENETTLFIDTWLMSCRVLKRGMEDFVLNFLIDFSKEKGYSQLKGEYIPTKKNEIVKDHFYNLNFIAQDGFWYLDINKKRTKNNFISKKK